MTVKPIVFELAKYMAEKKGHTACQGQEPDTENDCNCWPDYLSDAQVIIDGVDDDSIWEAETVEREFAVTFIGAIMFILAIFALCTVVVFAVSFKLQYYSTVCVKPTLEAAIYCTETK